MALTAGYRAGRKRTAIEGWSPEWHGCVYIDLPTGQVSWHFHDDQAHLFAFLPPYEGEWDGHDTPEKYRRVLALTGEGSALSRSPARGHGPLAPSTQDQAKREDAPWRAR
jgi:hypothetical protein